MNRYRGWLFAALVVVLATWLAPAPAAQPRKKLLALGDTRTGFTHDSIGHALAVIEAPDFPAMRHFPLTFTAREEFSALAQYARGIDS